MRIKTQFLISITAFTVILIIIGSSVALTQLQITQLNSQEATAHDIQTGASNLNYISSNYFLYQSNSSIDLWQAEFSTLSAELTQLNSTNTQQQTLVSTVNDDLVNLNSVFSGVTAFLNNAPRNESIRVLPSFQTQWNRMAVQIQALSFDSQQLSQAIKDQSDQTIFINTVLTIALMALFITFFVAIYLLNSRRMLKSISELKTGISVIGSGNLDHTLEAGNKDEIADISMSINKMATDLKTTTASKNELEKEIEERKKAAEALRLSEAHYRTLFSSIGEGFELMELIFDENKAVCDLRYLEVNDAYEKQTGLKAQDVLGKSVKDLFPKIEGMWIEVFDKVIKTGLPTRLEDFHQDTNRYYSVYYFPFGKSQVGVLFSDVTEREKAEKALEENNRNLESLVEERTKQLKDAERLAAIGATAGMVGHDIRNPLQAITGDLYLARMELAEGPDCVGKTNALESINEIEKNVDYINKIVQDLQDYARPLNPRVQETNIKTLFNEIFAKNGFPKNIEYTVDVEEGAEKIMTDPDYLKRIAANLTLNALQAMPDGGKLAIRAVTDKKTNDVLITVKDTGVGIPEDIKPKLFTPMMTTKSKGQGFGLAVVKRMTEGLGGTVTFESQEGKGTTFTVRLPPYKELNGKLAYK